MADIILTKAQAVAVYAELMRKYTTAQQWRLACGLIRPGGGVAPGRLSGA